MIDEVLLTEDEMEKAIGGEFVDDPLMILDFQSACKAAQLKLLEWGQQECIEHKRIAKLEGMGSIPDATFETYETHFQCHQCMAELESELKEG